MCNQYGERIAYQKYVEELSELRIPLRFPPPERAPNLEPRELIRPTDLGRVLRPLDETAPGQGLALADLKWGFKGGRPKAPPVINFRSEGREFTRGRCLIPASYFFEFTGEKYPKTRWRFTLAGHEWFCIAGLWRASEDAGEPDRYTMLTCAPGDDVAPYHDRQIVVLPPQQWAGWLDLANPASQFARPLPGGTLEVEKVS